MSKGEDILIALAFFGIVFGVAFGISTGIIWWIILFVEFPGTPIILFGDIGTMMPLNQAVYMGLKAASGGVWWGLGFGAGGIIIAAIGAAKI